MSSVPPGVLAVRASYAALGPAVREMFAAAALSLRGASVLVKPNMLGAYAPEAAVTTHPALVRAVVDHLLDSGARPVVGDNAGARGYGINRRCAEVTGILEASRGRWENIAESTVEVPTNSPFTRTLRVSRVVVEADLVINLPKLKTHIQTLLTAGVKNTFGYLVGAEKSRVHSLARREDDFGRMLADVFLVRPPDLTIIDAVTAMEGDGPSSGRPKEVGLLIGATNAVAADHVACRVIGLEPRRVAYLRALARLRPNVGQIDVAGQNLPETVAGFRLPSTFGRGLKSYLANRLVFTFLRRSRLRVLPGRCNGCGVCRDACPADAITVPVGGPMRIDRDRCFACYCCHELCPHHALEMQRIARALFRS